MEEKKRRRSCAKGSMVDILLQLADDPIIDVKLTCDNIKGITQVILDFIEFLACTDTAAITIEWSMSKVLKQSQIIKKASEELDGAIGNGRWVEEYDIPNLPYIGAIMKETMRKHPTTIMLPLHDNVLVVAFR
ncbi:cytochrome P450 93B16-like [Carya illinoinensis]|uniref:cytochrome P450 93B16-like n=1 Tax=Carya illinoinensis TaxID=32201 RepID=UPI001C71B302|nr:cytochrome P450 93B16-like [Carya illinoinensis]